MNKPSNEEKPAQSAPVIQPRTLPGIPQKADTPAPGGLPNLTRKATISTTPFPQKAPPPEGSPEASSYPIYHVHVLLINKLHH